MSITLLNKELIEGQKISKVCDKATAKALLIAKNKAKAVDILLKLSSSLQFSNASQVDSVAKFVLTITDD